MQPHYHITASGLKRVTATSHTKDLLNDDIYQLLIFILNKHINACVSFSEVAILFNNEKTRTFKVISKMLSLQLIDMNESNEKDIHDDNQLTEYFLNNLQIQNQYVLSDLNGLPISASGFDQQQIINLSAMAYDYIKASKRSRHINDTADTDIPLSITTSWGDMNITIYLLYFNKFSCLLTTTGTDFINSPEFIKIASYVCSRYNYE